MCQALDWGVSMNKARMVPVGWSQEIPPLKERTLCIQREPQWIDMSEQICNCMILASFVVCAF